MITTPSTRHHRIFLILVALFAFVAAFHDLINADYWFHLRGGAAVASGELPRVDSYSYPSAGNPYIDLHWLFQLGLFLLYRAGGVSLTLWVKAVLVALTFTWLYHIARQSAPPWVAGPVVMLATVLSCERFLARPEILSFLFLTTLFAFLAREAKAPSKLLWVIPPLFLVWANTEGIFVVGLGVLGAHALQRFRDRRLWFALALSLGAICMNPYGLEGALHPLVLFTRISGSLAVYSSSIGEFLSPFASSANHPAVTLFPYYLGLLALALGLSRRPRLSEAIIVAAFVFLSVKARRNLALLGIATAPILSRWLWQATQTEPLSGLWRRVPRGAGRRVRNVGAVACLGLLGAYTYALVSGRTYTTIESNRFFGAGVAELAFPQAAAERIRAMGAPGPVFSDLSAGSYLIWADPERPVFIDGRLEVHDTEHFARYLAMLSGGEAWTQADREFGFQTVILDHGAARTLTGKLLVDGTWALCHVDAQAIVLVRRTEENADFLAAHAIRPEEVETIAPPIGPPAAELVPPPPGFWQRTFGWRRYPWSELGMGQILFQAGRYDRAAEQYRRAVHRSPILASPRILLAGALNQLRRPDEAFSVLEGAEVLARTAADKGRLQATRGDVLLAVGRFDDAVAAYDSWLPESSAGAGSAVGRINRAMALHGVGRSEEAAAAVRRALVDLPTYVEGYRILGEIEEARGQTAAAVSSYEIYRNSGGTNEAALQALQRLDPSQ